MAISFWWLGHATTTTAMVCVRSTSSGAISLTCAGQTVTGTSVNTSDTSDGTATATVTGLTPNTAYAFTVTDAGGATASGTLRTFPSSGGKVAFMSCEDGYRQLDDLVQNVLLYGAMAVFQQGDYIYTSYSGTLNGVTTTVPTTGSASSVYAAHWQQQKLRSDMMLLERSIPSYYIADDHEYGGDNWDHSVTQAQVSPNVASGGTQAQVDAAWLVGNQAVLAYAVGNPPCTDAEAAGTVSKPSNALAANAANYPIRYHRVTVGSMEIFHIDCISYRDPLTKTDNAAKTMLGAVQKTWLKTRLDLSTAPFKIIASGKTTFAAKTSGTGDDWLQYTAERDELINYINTNASGNLKGVVWICGDAHGAFVYHNPATQHISICANPAGVDHIAQTSGYQAGVIWKEQGNSGTNVDLPGCFGLAEATTTTLTLSLVNQYGALLWRGFVDAGTNLLRAGQ